MAKKQHKFTIDVKKFDEIIGFVSPAVEQRTSNVYARSYLIDVQAKKVVVRANNSLIEATYTYEGEFELQGDPITFCVDNFVRDIIKKLRKNVSFIFEGDEVLVSTGRKKHRLALADATKFPPILPKPDNLEPIKDINNFLETFNKTNFAVSTLPDDKMLQTFYIDGETLLTSNRDQGILMSTPQFDRPTYPPAVQFMSALKATKKLKFDDEDELWQSLSKDVLYVKLVFDPDATLEYNVSPITGDYPSRIREVLDETKKLEPVFQFVITKETLREVINDCMLYYNKGAGDGQSPGMRIEYLGKKKVNFSIHIEDLSRFDHTVTIDDEPNGEVGFKETIDPQDLLKYVTNFEGPFTFKFYDPEESPIFFIDDAGTDNVDYMQVTMADE